MVLKSEEVFSRFKEIVGKLEKERILIALCGGSSVGKFYEEIGKRFKELPYNKLKFFMLDERFEEKERNFKLVEEKIINKLDETTKKEVLGNFYFIEGKTIEDATKNYEEKLREISSDLKFDVIIASVGEDCHIASLFPESKLLGEKRRDYDFILDSPKMPKERISLLPESIINSGFAFLFFIGEKKKQAYERFLKEKDEKKCPALLIKKMNYEVVR